MSLLDEINKNVAKSDQGECNDPFEDRVIKEIGKK